ncbi:MAG: hypothetical protein O3A63_16370 [Proteobacteria bacterium]|nr:hypothetical protein [Pseudomonadota bacterium]
MKRIFLVCFALTIMIIQGCSSMGSKPMTAQGLFDRHMAATYGSKGPSAFPSVTTSGKLFIDSFGLEAAVKARQMAPDSSSTLASVMGMELHIGCHAGECWEQAPGAGIAKLSGDRLTFQLQQADLSQYSHMDQYYATLEIVPEAEGVESNTVEVRATRENGSSDSYFFAKDSGLIQKTVLDAFTAQGKMKVTANSKKYAEFNGLTLATEVEQVTPMATIRIVIEDVSFDALSAADFKH